MNSIFIINVGQIVLTAQIVVGSGEERIARRLRKKHYSFSSIMTSDKKLEVLALRPMEEGSCKNIKKYLSVWTENLGGRPPVGVLVEGLPDTRPQAILREIHITNKLIKAGVPRLERLHKLPVPAGTDEVLLWMKLARHGDFLHYSEGHFDENTGRVLDAFRMDHLNAMYYVAEMLCLIHKNGRIHGDLTMQNVLVTSDEPIDIRLIDFGLSGKFLALNISERIPLEKAVTVLKEHVERPL